MLEVESLNQYYGGSHILRDVKLTVPDGKLTVLLGRNGVGKTTLLRCLMGVVPTQKRHDRLARHADLIKLPTYSACRERPRLRAARPRYLRRA